MTRELALEGGPHDIRANTISPGIIETPATAPALAPSSFREDHLASVMLRPDRHAAGRRRARRCSSRPTRRSWVTGANIVVDGGYTAR